MTKKHQLPHIPLTSPIFEGYSIDFILDQKVGVQLFSISEKEYGSKIFITFQEELSSTDSLLGYICTISDYKEQTVGKDVQSIFKITPVERVVHTDRTKLNDSYIYLANGIESNHLDMENNEAAVNITKKVFGDFKTFWESYGGTFPPKYTGVKDTINTVGFLLYTAASDEYVSFSEDLFFVDTEDEILTVCSKLIIFLESLNQETIDVELGKEITKKVMESMTEEQRMYSLRKQLEVVRKELGEDSNGVIDDFKKKTLEGTYPPEVKEFLDKNIKRLEKISQQSAEFQVQEQHISTILDYPWNVRSQVNLDLNRAKGLLDETHYGMEDVKKRILRYLAVKKQNPSNKKGTIICLAGPPGVGKTSICKNIAKSLGIEFQRIGLGGVSDESEIRGHRRTYVGAMEGKIASAVMKSKKSNPLIVLDEIDKLGKHHGQDAVQAALLEVLDPEQNSHFNDHYFEVPVDLSNVFFIATANDISSISAPLRDRMEFVFLSSYIEKDKVAIAKKHLIPEIRKDMNVEDAIQMNDKGLSTIINKYTRESGVRNLKQKISACFGEAILDIQMNGASDITIDDKFVYSTLGNSYIEDDKIKELGVGRAVGLAWTSVGGDVLYVECAKTDKKGSLLLTGQLGDVMKESAQIAMTVLDQELDQKVTTGIHIHFPDGATPKDGPSAGVTLVTSLYSLVNNTPMRKGIAMTGEVSLKGDVLPVGGIKEKVIAAFNKGIRTIILPEMNRKDIKDIPEEITSKLTVKFVSKVQEVIELSFNKK